MTGTIRTRARQTLRSPRLRLATRLAVGVGVLLAVVARVGTGPLLHGIQSLDGRTIGAALVLGAIATVAAAWRWRIIAARLGLLLPLPNSVAMYYRSQFLNTVLPGGVVGDVHRAIAAGHRTEIGSSGRSVALERAAGQVVQVTLAVVVLAFFGAEFEGPLLATVAIGLGAVAIAGIAIGLVSLRARRMLLREPRRLGAALGSPAVAIRVSALSVIVVACHIATFTIATAAVGTAVAPLRMLTLAFVVLLGASIPLNVGGWGPREGIAGWAFALAGFGAAAGVSASTLFGALTIISVAPGAVITAVSALRRRRTEAAAPRPAEPAAGPQRARAPIRSTYSPFALAAATKEKTP
jgi:uncharacterized membrane protein YbhN (UPF0104 family)